MNSKMTMNQTIADKIYNKLKEDITITVKIKLGQRVNIKKISEDFGISQIPIREALNRRVIMLKRKPIM
jgi:DNA-binding GntR family transcriptional regulator